MLFEMVIQKHICDTRKKYDSFLPVFSIDVIIYKSYKTHTNSSNKQYTSDSQSFQTLAEQ